MAGVDNLKPFTKNDPRRINKPKGTIHLSTHIQNLLNDEEFTLENFLFNGKQYKGAPIKAIITVGIMNALQGDQKWAEWLAKHGYGTHLNLNIDNPIKLIVDKYGGSGGVSDLPTAPKVKD